MKNIIFINYSYFNRYIENDTCESANLFILLTFCKYQNTENNDTN